MINVPGVVRTYRKRIDSKLCYDIDFRSDDPDGFTPKLEVDETIVSYTLEVTPPLSITLVMGTGFTGIYNEDKVFRVWVEDGDEGAIVIITVSIVTSGSVERGFPAREYSRSIAIIISGMTVGTVDSNCCLPDEGDEGDVLTVVGGNWSSQAPSGGPGGVTPPTNPGDDYFVAYALAGDLAYAANVRVNTDEAGLRFGGAPGISGFIGVSPASVASGGARVLTVRSEDLVSTANLIRYNAFSLNAAVWGDEVIVSGMRYYCASAGRHGFYVSSGLEYDWSSTEANWYGNGLVGTAYVSQDGSPSSTGWLRGVGNGTHLAVSRSGGDHKLLSTDAANNYGVGDPDNTLGLFLEAMVGGQVYLRNDEIVIARANGSGFIVEQFPIFLENVATVPTAATSGHGTIYEEGGAMKHRGTDDTVTTIAPA